MSITVGNYSFEGPFPNTGPLRNQSGVYAILTLCPSTSKYTVVDIGESGSVRDRVANHDRTMQWNRVNKGTLHVAAYYCDEECRIQLESTLRLQFAPACGVR
jgi:hypothetical protein